MPSILDRLLDLEKNPAARSYSDGEYNLDRFRDWVDSLGAPDRRLRFLHIAGTKGKGSTAALIEAMLLASGFSTGLYTSPHLRHFGERFRFDGTSWSEAEFTSALERFFERLTPGQRVGLEAPHSFRTVFETLTALALDGFDAHARGLPAGKPHAVIWETGLGGRLDCTNIVQPEITIITTMGMDHVRILGDTIEKIAAEKAGIIKPRRPVIVSRQVPEHASAVLRVISKRSSELNAPLIHAWEHNPVISATPLPNGQRLQVRMPDGALHEADIPLRGDFQQANAEAAIAAAWTFLSHQGLDPEPGRLLAGLQGTRWAGRLEVVRNAEGLELVLDGAHCPLSAKALAAEIPRLFPATADRAFLLLFGMQRDKDARAFLRAILPAATSGALQGILTYPVSGPRSADPSDLAATCRELGVPAIACNSVQDAVGQLRAAGLHGLATGSLYCLGAMADLWRPPLESK